MNVDRRSGDPARLFTAPLLRVVFIDICALTTLYLLLAAMPIFAASKGTSGAGVVTAALMWSTLVAELATPWLVARFGYRLMLATAIGLIGAPPLVLGHVGRLGPMLIVCGVCGLGFGVVGVAAGALSASLLPAARRGEGLGLIGVAAGVPGVLGLPLGVWLAEHLGFTAVFSIAGAATLAAVVVVPRLPHRPTGRGHGEGKGVGALRDMRSWALLGPATVFLATTCAAGIVVAFLPLALGHRSATLATVGLLVQGASATISRGWVGRLSDRHGAANFLVPGLIATVAGILLLTVFSNWTVLLTAMVLFGAGFGVVENSTLTLMVERVGHSGYAAANAVWNLAYDGGWGLGAAAFGLIVVHTGYAAAFAITGALITVALIPALSERRNGPQERKRAQRPVIQEETMSTREQSPIDQVARSQGHSTVTSGRRARLIAMFAATIATSLIWLVGRALGANFTLQEAGKSITINLPAIIGFTLCFSGIGWATLALLERYTRSPMTTWTLLAGSVYLLSVIPIFAEHATASTRTALVLIHTTVAAILIPLLRRTASASSLTS